MIIVGINAYHGDSSACLLKDGKLVAAAEEERFRRIKHWAGFPTESTRYCLDEAGCDLSDVDYVAINQSPTANTWRKIGYLIKNKPDLNYILDRLKNRHKRIGVSEKLVLAFPASNFHGKVRYVEHHIAHLASAHSVSPFEESTVVSVDGFGDFASTAWGIGRGSKIDVEGRIYFPHSLGIFYMALTQYLGFPTWGDEYKVMGLAPYGKPEYVGQMGQIVKLLDNGEFRLNLDYFQHHMKKSEIEWDGDAPMVQNLFSPALESLLGPSRKKTDELTQKHKDIACSIQAIYEKAFLNLLNKLYERNGLEMLSLAGGCAMNSVANGKIYKSTPFKKVYIQAAAGDAGGAIGAALMLWHQVGGEAAKKRGPIHDHAYWGPAFSDEQIGQLLESQKSRIEAEGCVIEHVSDIADLAKKTATEVADGKVIGWFQGRMEWGPRALGNRSIVCDPRRADMKGILNLKIKRRESFRPFAPSILREAVPDWFEQDDDVPFMMQVYQIREEKRAQVPAVTHVDGSGRLQTVYEHSNPRYYALISAFNELTGVPMVLNTSFNENEPVVCKPEEALETFLRTRMDVLVMGGWVLSRG